MSEEKKKVEPYVYEWTWYCPECSEQYWGDFPGDSFKCRKCNQQFEVAS